MISLFMLFLLIVCQAEGARKLEFVHAIWRHGARSQEATFVNDKMKLDSDWKEGGGGFGQLTTNGMRMHLELGKKLRTRYIDTGFLSPHYTFNEVYIRSTDYNRTLISAMSNMLGMYGQPGNANRPGVDYPVAAGWPTGYVPVPVHTVDKPTDYVANPDAKCKRQDQLFDLVQKSDEWMAYENDPNVKALLKTVSDGAGQEIGLLDLWILADSLFIQELFFPANISAWYPWYPPVKDYLRTINNAIEDFQIGFGVSEKVQGIDTTFELKSIRGGALLRSINNHLKQKLDTVLGVSNDGFYSPLKYYVISAHDTTLSAYMSVLGVKQALVPEGGYSLNIPYTATILTELYHDDVSGEDTFRLLYHRNETSDFDVVTHLLPGCSSQFCPLSALDALAQHYDPGDNAQLCATSLFGASSSSTSSAAMTTTTTKAASKIVTFGTILMAMVLSTFL